MATLVLTAVGTVVGGPIGGAIGAIIGRQIDGVLFGSNDREGPRLTDLAVQTSQYGSLVPRIYGRMRVAGTVIWATDLIESRERQGGGKGRPGTVQFSYGVSMAVVLSSRPLRNVKRIWAEGNLLRGEAGDFKTNTGFRFYNGHGDQDPDPLITALEGEEAALGYRGLAYCVFEELDLTDFGNRIPSLTFEVEADDAPLSPSDIFADFAHVDPNSPKQPAEILGYSAQADRQVQVLDELATSFPHHIDWSMDGLRLARRDLIPANDILTVRDADIIHQEGDSGTPAEQRMRPHARAQQIQLRYYEPERDYQAGIRRSLNGNIGRAPAIFDMPAALTASNAQNITQRLYRYSQYQDRERTLHMARLDPMLRPGRTIRIENEAGLWRIDQWRFSVEGVSLELIRDESGKDTAPAQAEAGRSLSAPDQIAIGGALDIFDLPATAELSPNAVNLAATVREDIAGSDISGASIWRGGALYRATADGGLLDFIGPVQAQADYGTLLNGVSPATGIMHDYNEPLIIAFEGADPFLANIDQDGLSNGDNMLLLGDEVIQFERADFLGEGQYHLSGLYRALGDGLGGENGHEAGTRCLLLNHNVAYVPASGNILRQTGDYALVSRGVSDLSFAQTSMIRALRPLPPVHLCWQILPPSSNTQNGQPVYISQLRWTRRSRIPFLWSDGVDMPLVEEREAYSIGFWQASAVDHALETDIIISQPPLLSFETDQSFLNLSVEDQDILTSSGETIVAIIRHLGTYATSKPATLYFQMP